MKQTFEIKSGTMCIGDPCYNKDENLCAIVYAKNGTWEILVEYSHGRIAFLEAKHSIPYRGYTQKDFYQLGVDSGQMAIFDANSWQNDELVEDVPFTENPQVAVSNLGKWYSMVCEQTLSDDQCGVLTDGVVSSSGRGDGQYECVITKNKDNEAIAISISFMDDEENEWND